MFVHLSIHSPVSGREQELIDSMHRLGEADGKVTGLREVHVLRDRDSGALAVFAVWDSTEAFEAGMSQIGAAVEGDDLLALEDGLPEVYLLESV